MADIEVGVKLSVDEGGAEAKFERARDALGRFAKGSKKAGDEAEGAGDKAKGAGDKAKGAGDKFRRAGDRIRSSWKRAAKAVTSLRGALIAGGVGTAVAAVTRQVVDAGLQVERWGLGLKAVAGDTSAAAKEIDFLRGEAERLGLEFTTLADNYTLFAAASKGTAIEGRKTREIFVAVAESAAVLRLESESVRGVMLALTQMVSKGAISAEELRQQFGDRMPGALQAAERAFRTMTGNAAANMADMLKAVEQGQVDATEFLPHIARELQNTFGGGLDAAVESADSQFKRLKNALFDVGAAAAESGLLEWLGDVAGAAAGAIRALGGVEVPDARSPQDRLAAARQELSATATTVGRGRNERANPEIKRLTDEIEALERTLPENIGRAIEEAKLALEVETAALAKVDTSGKTRQQLARHGGKDAAEALAARDRVAGATVALRNLEAIQAGYDDDAKAAELERQRLADIEAKKKAKKLELERQRLADIDADEEEKRAKSVAAYTAGLRRRAEAEAELTEVQKLGLEVARQKRGWTAQEIEQAMAVAEAVDARTAAERDAAAAEEAETRRLEAQQALRDATLDALPDFQLAREEVEAWAEANIAKAGTDEQLAAAIAAVKDQILGQIAAEERLAQLRAEGGLAGAAAGAFDTWRGSAESAAEAMEGALVGAFDGATDALADFVVTGEANFKQFAESLIKDISRILIKQALIKGLETAFPNLFATQQHAGGVAGQLSGPVRRLPAALFAVAPRFHRGGLASNEVPAVLEKGERVLTKDQAAAGPSVTVQVINEGAPLEAAGPPSTEFDGERMVTAIVLRDIQDGGPIGRAIGVADRQR